MDPNLQPNGYYPRTNTDRAIPSPERPNTRRPPPLPEVEYYGTYEDDSRYSESDCIETMRQKPSKKVHGARWVVAISLGALVAFILGGIAMKQFRPTAHRETARAAIVQGSYAHVGSATHNDAGARKITTTAPRGATATPPAPQAGKGTRASADKPSTNVRNTAHNATNAKRTASAHKASADTGRRASGVVNASAPTKAGQQAKSTKHAFATTQTKAQANHAKTVKTGKQAPAAASKRMTTPKNV